MMHILLMLTGTFTSQTVQKPGLMQARLSGLRGYKDSKVLPDHRVSRGFKEFRELLAQPEL
jgi:hypothetical protein